MMKSILYQKCFEKPYLFLFLNTLVCTTIALVICMAAAFFAAGLVSQWTLSQCMPKALLITAWAGVIFGWYGGILYWMRRN